MMWRRKQHVPKGLQAWPAQFENLTTEQLIGRYNQGFAACLPDEEAREKLFDSQPYPDGEQAAVDFDLAGTGDGKLSMPFLPAWIHWPKCWPCPGQTTGDCVSHAGKNAALVLIGVECSLGQPDPTSLIVEDWPVVSTLAEEQGVVACEAIYGYRGHSGQGANCERLIYYTTTAGGILLRQNYPELGIDLTKYNASIGIRWGGSNPPDAVNKEGQKHQIRSATDAPVHTVVRDFNANGYPGWACSGLGWSSQRDENGYSRQQGGWSHSWCIVGFDDRQSTKDKYGFPLALFLHDWYKWNSGPRDIRDSAQYVETIAAANGTTKAELILKGIVNEATGNIMIPEGTMWVDARLLDKTDMTMMSNFNGFPRRELSYSII